LLSPPPLPPQAARDKRTTSATDGRGNRAEVIWNLPKRVRTQLLPLSSI
jgi:hypothetical protein